MKKQEAVNWAVKNIGNKLTAGQSNGAQCATFVIQFLKDHFDVHPTGNAKDFINFDYPKGFQIIRNTEEFVPQEGDIFVMDNGEFGHTGMVTAANQYLYDSIDQNWYNSSNMGSPAAFIQDHDYENFVGVIRPPYSDAAEGITTKSTKIETINQSINYTMNQRVGSIDGVVIHNTADRITTKEQYNRLHNASVARYEAGVAHYYGDRKTIWRAIDTFRIAWHVADNYGNGHYLGYEVGESMSANNKDFTLNEQTVFKQAAIDMLYYGLEPNRKTVKLHNQFVMTACPHRSMALHVNFDPVINGAPTLSKQLEMQDYFIKEIMKYYKNPTLKIGVPDNITEGVTIPTIKQKTNQVKAKSKKVGNGWKKNTHGILWKKEKATFTANTSIYTRYNGPWTGWEIAGMLYSGQSVNYNEVYDFDGYIWIAWTVNNGERVYMPIGNSNGNGGRIGDAWGNFS